MTNQVDNQNQMHPLQQNVESQMNLDLNAGKYEFWYKFKNNISKIERRFSALPILKHFIAILSFVLLIFVLVVPAIIVNVFWNQLPSSVPIFYSQDISSWRTFPKNYFFYIPLFLGTTSLICYVLTYKIYDFDRRLALILNVILVLFSIFYLIAHWQILLLLLV